MDESKVGLELGMYEVTKIEPQLVCVQPSLDKISYTK